MMNISIGYLWKMLLFVVITTVPIGIVSLWLQSHGYIELKFVFLLIGATFLPALLLYNRLVKEISAISMKMEKASQSPTLQADDDFDLRSGLLPVNELLLTMQHYRRVLRKLLEQAQSRQDDADFIFDMLPDPILILDRKRRISQSNAAAKAFFSTDTIIGDLSGYLRHPNLLKAVEATLRGDVTNSRVEFTMSDMVSRTVAAYVVSLEEKKDADLRLIVTLHDLTASKKMEQMRVDFVANASHELRTPLAILIGALETLMGPAREDSQARKRFLEMMQAQSSRMSQLINDLLSLSQIEINEHSRPSDTVDLVEVVQGVSNLIKTRACSLGKTIALEFPETPVSVAGDADQLTQIFTNLVDNALKYSRENSEVKVRISIAGKDAVVTIIDKGEGIGEEHLPRLTERFYRVDSDRSRELGGTGLGLAIVKHIVSRHRGQFEITSQVGIGSTFTVKLPLLN